MIKLNRDLALRAGDLLLVGPGQQLRVIASDKLPADLNLPAEMNYHESLSVSAPVLTRQEYSAPNVQQIRRDTPIFPEIFEQCQTEYPPPTKTETRNVPIPKRPKSKHRTDEEKTELYAQVVELLSTGPADVGSLARVLGFVTPANLPDRLGCDYDFLVSMLLVWTQDPTSKITRTRVGGGEFRSRWVYSLMKDTP